MSVESLAIVLHHSRAKGTAKVVLIGIANHDGDGGAWPSVATLAKYANVSRSNVQTALKSLEQLHEIRRHLGAGGDHSTADYLRPNLYEVTVQCPETCDRSRNHRPKRAMPQFPIDPALLAGQVSETGRDPALPTGHKPSLEPETTKGTEVTTRGESAAVDNCTYRPNQGHLEVGGYCAACSERLAPWDVNA